MARILCFGEILLRLAATGGDLLVQSRSLAVHVGGAEANVAAALAQLGHDAAVLSILPDSRLGDAAVSALGARGVDTRRIARRPGRMGLYFFEPGAGARAGEIVYDRAGSAFADGLGTAVWDDALPGGGWLHLSGITPALTAVAANATLALARAARAAGLRVSFDCNYRPSLWQASGGDAPTILGALAAEADLLFGNYRDAALLTGAAFDGDGPERRRAAAEALFAAFPNLTTIASTSRHVDGADTHRLSARIDTPDDVVQLDETALTGIVDRIGGGDAFAAGVLHGLATGGDPARAARLGLAAAVQKHFISGDVWIGDAAGLDAFVIGGTGDIRR
ncbi:PfkB family carbohydrate kinase [Sphingomonas flavalba]|uniref:PfkB family carbohydrate kinase n=1 Tax=Sphingomonas flavalba TaxID=2559804 RepID=UPI00109D9904|nr:PfkB family carbohydrate kinase [Sphingomonas flavalba]